MTERGSYCQLKVASIAGKEVSKTRYAPGPCPAHTHEHARFVFVVSGEFAEWYEGFQRTCRPGTVLFRPPGERHSELYGPEPVVSISVDLEPTWFDQLRQHDIDLSDSLTLRSGSAATLATRLDVEFSMGDTAASLAIEAILLEAAVEAARQRDRLGERSSPRSVHRATDFIHAGQAQSLTLAEISRAAGVHPVHLARMFRKVHRCSVGEYVRRLRIQAACVALRTSTASVSEIAASAGFADQSHLCRAFKRLLGVTPGRYRLLGRTLTPFKAASNVQDTPTPIS